MDETQSIEELLSNIHINIYDEELCKFRSFSDVLKDLAKSWETLSDDYKNKMYEAMGIMPSEPVMPSDVYAGSPRRCLETRIEYSKNRKFTRSHTL